MTLGAQTQLFQLPPHNLTQASHKQKAWPLDPILEDLKKIRGPKDLVDVAVKYNLLNDRHVEDTLREHWYDQNGNGWWRATTTWLIVRDSYIELIELLKENFRPVVTHWIPRNKPTFEVVNVPTEHQIIRVVLTPEEPRPRPAKMQTTEVATLFHEVGGRIMKSYPVSVV